ncbi:hypothetical protein D9619_004722 [Psilocybe cf. subviscida]|uniref:Uncharacterized protein n=1 Tax=Psilocybe cf. subviscida TaxID=2480587 RepID=A0A8H5F7Z6_9AGAR|nr:hypothetical protein D9619_004722 [Psilocybe cf. subviscida]
MSAPATTLAYESKGVAEEKNAEALEHERHLVEELTGITPPAPVIAVDLDDVLRHNEKYNTKITLDNFYYYYYWKNPYWGTPQETFQKVTEFYKTDSIYQTQPLPDAKAGLEELKKLGYRLIIVTARKEDEQDQSWEWVQKYFPGIFESIVCTGQFKDAHKTGHEIVTKLSKAQVCDDLGAKLLIDDSAENALQCSTASPAVPVLLFGDYQWNKRLCGPQDGTVEMSFDIRLAAEGGREFWKEETVPIPEGAPLWRVKNWQEAVEWVKKAHAEGRM